jgi:hypothetical protein
MDRVLEADIVVVSSPRSVHDAHADAHTTHRFSRKVFALTMFLPIALAFHAQKEPEGSTWNKLGPRFASQPATSSDTPYGRTPLFK